MNNDKEFYESEMTDLMSDGLRLWYRQPATKWTEALPIGNGRIGGMIYGTPVIEHIQLNEESVWDGFEKDRSNPRALSALQEVRKLLFEGRNQEAARLAEENMLADPLTVDSYQPLGNLFIELQHSDQIDNYQRELDIESGVVSVSYECDGYKYKKEYFCSSVDQVMCICITVNQPKGLSARIRLNRERSAQGSIDGRFFSLKGSTREGGVQFASVLEVSGDGHVKANEDNLLVDGTDQIIIYLTAGTNYWGQEPISLCKQRLENVRDKNFSVLKRRHIQDYRSLFGRVTLELGRSEAELLPTDERLLAFKKDGNDPSLFTLYFQYFRYLLISSSRPGGLPSNLQGIWNDQFNAPWNSDYHPNINMQINYWPAEVGNLPECQEPLFQWMKHVARNGAKIAHEHYGSEEGWVLHHISDIFGCAAPMDGLWGIWPMGGAWLSLHLYEHFLFGQDQEFLMNVAFPLMKGAALFLLDFLTEAPEYTPVAGMLVTNPSHSPENRFTKEDGTVSYLTYAATMDISIIHQLFTSCIESIDVIGTFKPGFEKSFRSKLSEALDQLPPLRISKKTGGIMEWVEDYDETEPGHRHLSHLFGLYPGNQISLEHTKELAEAAVKTLHRRLAHNYDGQGWSLGWMSCLWARLHDGEMAYKTLETVVNTHVLPNMFVNAHGNPQVGDAGGIPASIAEMLLQSHEGELCFLSALPKQWRDGKVEGLRARGGYVVDMVWSDGQLDKVRIQANQNQVCRVRSNTPLRIILPDRTITGNQLEFEVVKGHEYRMEKCGFDV